MTTTQELGLVEEITVGSRGGYDTRSHMEHAAQQAKDRNYQDIFIADIDAHHYERESWADIVKYIEDPVLRHQATNRDRQGRPLELFSGATVNQDLAGRILRYPRRYMEKTPEEEHREIVLVRRMMEAIGIDVQIVLPTPMLVLGLHPDPWLEVQLSWAYTRWMTEEILPHEPRMKTMIYLPFNDPEACLRAIEKFSDCPGVAGYMVTSPRFAPVHHNSYMPVYDAIQERNMPIAFHGGFNRMERLFEGMNRFLSVHSLGFVLSNMVHLTNLIVNGIPERFPELKIVMIESGLAWLPFMMQRLDNNYSMRSSEAPLLTKKPSEYMQSNFYYSTQPIENGNLEALELTMKMIKADTQLMFSSDYPHWDFNLPSTIYDLPFLKHEQKLAILGGNAKRVFKFE